MLFQSITLLLKNFIKKPSVYFLALFILSTPAGADGQKIIQATPALWKVEKGDTPTYILGTFHLLPANYRWYEGKIGESFSQADELVIEAKMTQEDQMELQKTFMMNGFFAGEETIKDHLDMESYQKLLTHAQNLMGAGEKDVQKMKPWLASLQMAVVAIMKQGFVPNSGVDKYMEAMAEKSGKAMSGLENGPEAMKSLYDHPMKVQVSMLADTLKQLDNFKSYMDKFVGAWASGNEDKLDEVLVQGMKSTPEMYQALLVDRNNKWLPKIEGFIKNGKTTFIAVGAGHLVGKDSVIALLRSKGYKVEKIQ